MLYVYVQAQNKLGLLAHANAYKLIKILFLYFPIIADLLYNLLEFY